jgi:hypothetical protein
MDLVGSNGGAALKVGVTAALVYDIISATNSSPQTTEINAAARAPTLMKWVKLGLLQAAGFVVLMAAVDDQHWPVLLGGSLAGGLLWWQYCHAVKCGQANPGPPTEHYGPVPPAVTNGWGMSQTPRATAT